MTDQKVYLATLTQKILLVLGSFFFAGASALGMWLWHLGHVPMAFGIVFGLFGVLFVIRLYRVISNPIVTVNGLEVSVLGWMWGTSEFHLGRDIDTAITSHQIFMKQGSIGAGITLDSVGDEAFNELVELLNR